MVLIKIALLAIILVNNVQAKELNPALFVQMKLIEKINLILHIGLINFFSQIDCFKFRKIFKKKLNS